MGTHSGTQSTRMGGPHMTPSRSQSNRVLLGSFFFFVTIGWAKIGVCIFFFVPVLVWILLQKGSF